MTNGRYRCSDGTPYNPGHLPSGFSDKWEIYDEEAHGKHNRDPVDAYYEDKYLKEIGKL